MHCPARYSCFICHLQHRQHQRHLSPPLPPVTQWETWARHIRAPRTWLHHIYVYKKIHTWCRETPGNPSSATAPAGGRHEEGSCTPSPRELQCQHHTPCPGSLTHTKTPQTWCCLYSSHSVTRRGRKVRDRGSRPNLQEMGPSSHPEGKRFGVQRLLVTSSQGLGKQPVLFGRTKSP